jgi:acetyl esterase/lipase
MKRRNLLSGVIASPLLGKRSTSAQTTDDVELRHEEGINYSSVNGTDLQLDITRPPDRERPRPAMILIHGGGLWQGS